MDGHRFVHRPRNFRGKVQGGRVGGCECGWMTFGGSLPDLLRAHRLHASGATPVTPVVEAPLTLDELTARLAELRDRAALLTAG